MTVYTNNQGTGLFIVFKFVDGELNTGSYNGSYARKPPARTYNTPHQAKTQWQRFIKDGYEARAAEITIDREGFPYIQYIDDDWVAKGDLCGFAKFGKKCKLPKDHEGIHK